jgi:hypothetical protein
MKHMTGILPTVGVRKIKKALAVSGSNFPQLD